MEKPTDYHKCLSILLLRFLGCSQDATGSILGCRNQTVVEAEKWFRTCLPDEATCFCDDQVIKRLVGREFPTFEEISPELLVKAGQVTADDILRHYRPDLAHIRPIHEEGQKFLELLQRWREQLRFLSVAELLRKYRFESWGTDAKCEVTEPEDVRQAYLHELGRHLETIPKPYKAMLPVQTESLFEQLKRLHADTEAWRAQDSWAEAYGIYFEAFSSWLVEVEYDTELLVGAAVDESASTSLDSNVANARRLVKEIKRERSDIWLFLRQLALAVACDLFLLGISERAARATWVPLELRFI
jgi:hypothetical protein